MALYPGHHFKLGRYLGLSMMAKIREENGQVLHWLTYQALTQDKWKSDECKQEPSSFMKSLHQSIGPHAMVGDLAELEVEDMLQSDQNEDELQN